VELDTIPQLPNHYLTTTEYERFSNFWSSTPKSKTEGFTLIKALFKTFRREWFYLSIILVLMEITVVSTPVLTALSISYITHDQGETGYAVLLFLATFGVMTLSRMFSTHFTYRMGNIGISMSNTVTMMIFNKSLKYSELGNKDFSEAEILNYSQVDA
jgi:hypothetical protein